MATETHYTESGSSPPLMPTLELVGDLVEYIHQNLNPRYPLSIYMVAARVCRWWPELSIQQRDELLAFIVESLVERGVEVQ